MKRETLQQHKEVVLVCEKGISEVEVISNVSIPQSNKKCIVQIITGQIIMLKIVKSKKKKTMFL
jgi:hypothetical protein